jgi:hypothetical protein
VREEVVLLRLGPGEGWYMHMWMLGCARPCRGGCPSPSSHPCAYAARFPNQKSALASSPSARHAAAAIATSPHDPIVSMLWFHAL